MEKKGLSPVRTSIEMLLLVIGLIAGCLLIIGLFVDISEENLRFDLEKTKEVISSITNFDLQSIVIIILAAIFLIFTIRFFFVLRKAKKKNSINNL